MKREWVVRARWSLLVVLACALLVLAAGAAKPSGQEPAPGFPRMQGAPRGGSQGILDQPGLFMNRRIADLSLAVREQVDFLLTPALLVQEAVSDDVVLTYPEE